MKSNFSLTSHKKYKVIIDTDPGVDDIACLIHAFADEDLDILLFTTVNGNVDVHKSTRNLLHVLDLFNVDTPVAMGEEKPLERISPDASFIHQKEGLGGYFPPDTTVRKIIDDDAVTALYKVLKNGDGDIIPIVLGPHTNIGKLLTKYPDVKEKIPKIYFMGGSPYGYPDMPKHISFNISTDPEAFKIVLDSKIPLAMIPSAIGRKKAHLDEKFVTELAKVNDVGKLLYKMYSKYWEPGYPDKRVATNDSCALLFLLYPEIFSAVKVDVTVDTDLAPGKTIVSETPLGNVDLVLDADRDAFLKILVDDVKKLSHVKIDKSLL